MSPKFFTDMGGWGMKEARRMWELLLYSVGYACLISVAVRLFLLYSIGQKEKRSRVFRARDRAVVFSGRCGV